MPTQPHPPSLQLCQLISTHKNFNSPYSIPSTHILKKTINPIHLNSTPPTPPRPRSPQLRQQPPQPTLTSNAPSPPNQLSLQLNGKLPTHPHFSFPQFNRTHPHLNSGNSTWPTLTFIPPISPHHPSLQLPRLKTTQPHFNSPKTTPLPSLQLSTHNPTHP